MTAASSRRAALGLMVASGFAGLGYQIVWTQQGALWLGHEAAAVLAVVTALFAGLGVGALVLGPRIERSARPERWYAGCEIAIAGWGLLLAVALAPLGHALVEVIGVQPAPAWQWAVAFFGSFVLLLPATAAMGATLPAMERLIAPARGERQTLAGLYAGNTFGAVLGVLATAFWLVPAIGLARTAALCAALNVACAFAALRLSPRVVRDAPPIIGLPAALDGANVLPLLAVTGLLGIGYEVLVVRVLSQVTEGTVYTFAMLLAVYLVGSALGAAAYQRWGGRAGADAAGAERLRGRLLALQAAACLLGSASLWEVEHSLQAVQQALGGGLAAALASEAALAVAAFGLPTVVMGALFSHLAVQARRAGRSFGQALGCNTLGAAVAPPLFGVLLLPALGPKFSLLIVAAGYLAPGLARLRSTPSFWPPAVAGVALALFAPPLAFVDVPEGGRIVSYREGALAAVSVVEDANGVARLRIDNHQQEGSSATRLADARQALLPLLLHPAPQRALFLGLGTGVTAASAAEDPGVQVDAVELLPEVIAASAHFVRTAAAGSPLSPPAAPLHVMAADARRFVRTTGQRYDLIVSDNFHPARSGSGSLYTVEHFEAVRARLAEHGVFCQWLPLHQLDLDTLRSIVRAFVAVNPRGFAMLATNSLETPVLGLVVRADATGFDLAQVRGRLAGTRLPERLAEVGIVDEFALLGSFVAGPQALARFAGDAPLNTDDRPVVAYRAPRVTYAPDSAPRDRLLALLRQLHIEPAELMAAGTDAGWSQRLAAYWAARDHFLEAGRDVQPSPDLQVMLAQVRAPLLAVLRSSADFRPAYDPLLRMAVALAQSDPAAARALLIELARLQPARPEAALALDRLQSAPR